MKAVFQPIGHLKFALLGTAFFLLSGLTHQAWAENNFLAGIPAGSNTYPAIATIGVDTPSGVNSGTGEFIFDGVADFFFDVSGDVRIWRSGPLDTFNDPITGNPVGAAADGLNTLRLEMVNISNVNVSATGGAVINSVQLGDGVDNGSNDGPLFSTGGAAEIGPNGETANGFLNLFMEIDIAQPLINVPGALQGAPFFLDPTYTIGPIHNNDVLTLEAVIDDFAPEGITFMQVGGPVGFFAPISNQLVIDLAPLRGLTEMRFAQFVSTNIQIVPEPGSIAFGLMGVVAFGTFAWRKRRRAVAA